MKKLVILLFLVTIPSLTIASSELVETVKSINPHLKKMTPLETSIDPQTDLYRKIEDLTKKSTFSAQDLFDLSLQKFNTCSEITGSNHLEVYSPLLKAQKNSIDEIAKEKSWPKALHLASMWAQLQACEAVPLMKSISSHFLNSTLEAASKHLNKNALTADDRNLIKELQEKITAYNPSAQVATGARIYIVTLASLVRRDIKNGELHIESLGKEVSADNKVFPQAVLVKKEIPFSWNKAAPIIAKILDITAEAPENQWKILMDQATDPALEAYYSHMQFKKYGIKKAQDLMNPKKMAQLNRKIAAQPKAAEQLIALHASFEDKESLLLKHFAALAQFEYANLETKLKASREKSLKLLNAL